MTADNHYCYTEGMENNAATKKGKTVVIYNCKDCKNGRRVEYTADGVRMDSTGDQMILSMIEVEVTRVVAKKNIYPNPLESDGRIVRRGEVGEIQDEADGFFFVEFSDGYISMCDKSELRPA